MRYPASEKLEIIRLVEQSHLPARRTLEKLGIQPSRFYRWYDRLQTGGPEALEDKTPRPKNVWWPWMSLSYHHGNWPRALQIQPTTLCQKLRSIGCLRRMT